MKSSYFTPKEWALLVTLAIHLVIVLAIGSRTTHDFGTVEEQLFLLQFEEPENLEEVKERPKLEPLVPVDFSNIASSTTADKKQAEEEEANSDGADNETKDKADPKLLEELLKGYGAEEVKPAAKDEEPKRIRRQTKDGVAIVDPYTGESNIYYTLPGREDIEIPNPIYLCEGGGKVVVNIVVSWDGYVTRAEINKTKSVRQNFCLYDQALAAAQASTFTPYTYYKNPEMGSITFIFKHQ